MTNCELIEGIVCFFIFISTYCFWTDRGELTVLSFARLLFTYYFSKLLLDGWSLEFLLWKFVTHFMVIWDFVLRCFICIGSCLVSCCYGKTQESCNKVRVDLLTPQNCRKGGIIFWWMLQEPYITHTFWKEVLHVACTKLEAEVVREKEITQ